MSTSLVELVSSVKRSETPNMHYPHSSSRRHEHSPKMGNCLEQCLLKGIVNVVSSVPQGRQGVPSPSKTPPRPSRTSLHSSTPLIPTHSDLDLATSAKLVILSQDGRLMQYRLGDDMHQSPEQVLRLCSSSTAAVQEGVGNNQWLLNVVSKGNHALSRSRSLSRVGWSRKLSLRTDSKRHTSEMLLVFEEISMLEEWLTTIRKAIEAVSGVPYLLGLVSPPIQTDKNWLNIVTMPFKSPPPHVYSSGDTACPSRGSTSTSLSSHYEVEWNPSTKHVSAGSGSSVYANSELGGMRQSRSSSYSSAQASSRTSLGNSEDLAFRLQKAAPTLSQAPDSAAREGHGVPDAHAPPQTLDLKAMAETGDDTRGSSIQVSPKLLISPAERTPTLPPEAVHLMIGNQPLSHALNSPHQSVDAATMQSWLDNAKVQALQVDPCSLEVTTPSSAIFRDFEFSWTDTPQSLSGPGQSQGQSQGQAWGLALALGQDKTSLESGRCPPSPTILVVPESIQTKRSDSESRVPCALSAPAAIVNSDLLSPAPRCPIPEFSPTLAAFPQPGTWQPAVSATADDGGISSSTTTTTTSSSRSQDLPSSLLPASLSRTKPVRTVSSDSPRPQPFLQPPACSALHMRRRKTMPSPSFRSLPPVGPPPMASLPPIPAGLKRDSGLRLDTTMTANADASFAPIFTAEPSSYSNIEAGAALNSAAALSSPPRSSTRSSTRSSQRSSLHRSSYRSSSSSVRPVYQPHHQPGESQSQRSSTQTPLPAADAIAELALQLSILSSKPSTPVL